MKEVFLGTGANGGTPQIDCKCQNCEAAVENPSLQRLRSSVLVETSKNKIVLDCGPDFRLQLLRGGLRLQDINLIAITHLHFDHSGGLMELSAGKALNIPVLVSPENQKILEQKPDIQFLLKAGFMQFADNALMEIMGVKLVEVPHDPRFPTNAVVINDRNMSIWYSPDVTDITESMKKEMKKTDLVIFDATFMNEDILPASKFNHTTIEKSAPEIYRLDVKTIFSHINHSENPNLVLNFLSKFGFSLAHDIQIELT